MFPVITAILPCFVVIDTFPLPSKFAFPVMAPVKAIFLALANLLAVALFPVHEFAVAEFPCA